MLRVVVEWLQADSPRVAAGDVYTAAQGCWQGASYVLKINGSPLARASSEAPKNVSRLVTARETTAFEMRRPRIQGLYR